MCSACGVLSGAPDWLDRAGNPNGIGTGDSRLAERQKLIGMVNKLLKPSRATLADYGEKLILRSPTGQTKIVDNLAHVWLEADNIGLRAVDPLDEEYLMQLI
ncbi:MAG: hypothetical protein IJ125_06600 [Atopobiaceae bacterium]|nr:hypothetical protein [Atopobiaceae bacterium]